MATDCLLPCSLRSMGTHQQVNALEGSLMASCMASFSERTDPHHLPEAQIFNVGQEPSLQEGRGTSEADDLLWSTTSPRGGPSSRVHDLLKGIIGVWVSGGHGVVLAPRNMQVSIREEHSVFG